MDRVSSTGYQTIGGKRFWQDANEGAGIQGTDLEETWFNGVQESIIGVSDQMGIASVDQAAGSADLQLFNAISMLAGGAATSVVATGALTAANAGLVLVNATSGSIVITLPLSTAANGKPLRFRFVRTDATTNTVSIA